MMLDDRFGRSWGNGTMIAVRTAKAVVPDGCGQNLVFCTLRPAIMSSVFVGSLRAIFMIEFERCDDEE
jgi:hypothetical protein